MLLPGLIVYSDSVGVCSQEVATIWIERNSLDAWVSGAVVCTASFGQDDLSGLMALSQIKKLNRVGALPGCGKLVAFVGEGYLMQRSCRIATIRQSSQYFFVFYSTDDLLRPDIPNTQRAVSMTRRYQETIRMKLNRTDVCVRPDLAQPGLSC